MARFYAPSTVFFDEVDALFSRRGDGFEGEASKRVKAELLVQMDGVSSDSAGDNPKRIIVLAATNRPWDLDEALIRRLEKRICTFCTMISWGDIGLPSKNARKSLFKLNLKDIKMEEKIDWEVLVAKTQGYSGADIANVCREAALMPLRRKLKEKIDLQELAKMQSTVVSQYCVGELEKPISMEDLNAATKSITRTVVSQYLGKYEEWMKQFGAT